MNDDNTIAVVKPGTKVHVIDNLGNLLWEGVVRRFSVSYVVPIPSYEIEVQGRKEFVTICNSLWEVKPVPPPTWVVIDGYGVHAVIRRGTLVEGRIVFAKKDDTFRRKQTGGDKFCTVFVKDTEAAAEKMAALLNEIEAE